MALPGDLTTFDLQFGAYTDAQGLAALVAAGGKLFAVDPSSNKKIRLTHITSGQVIVPDPVDVTIGEDGTGVVTGIPHTGQATISPAGYAWRVEWNIASNKPSPGNLTFVVDSGATADFDLLVPAATVPAVAISQPTVASVNGQTGAVSLDAADVGAATPGDLAGKADLVGGKLPEAQVPARLSDVELRATFGALVTLTPERPTSTVTTPTSADDFATGAALAGRSTPTGGLAWTQQAGTFTVTGGALVPASNIDGDLATFPGCLPRCTIEAEVVPYDNGPGAGRSFPGVVFRYQDPGHFFYVFPDSDNNLVNLYRVTGGGHTQLIELSIPLASGEPVTLRLDCNGPDITLYVNGSEVVNIFEMQGVAATGVGVRNGLSNGGASTPARWNSLTVRPLQGPVFNWPRTFEASGSMSLDKGADPEWDSTDVNNPNVVRDPTDGRWVKYYSGYYDDGTHHGVQAMGVAYADTPFGPWTKDPANPVFTDPASGQGSMNGGLVYLNGEWIHVYAISDGAELAIARGPDLTSLTKEGVTLSPTGQAGSWEKFKVMDAFLRVRQDGLTLELWYAGLSDETWTRAIGYATSIDGGRTWTRNPANPVLTPPPFANGELFAEPSCWVPPGREGQEMMVLVDFAFPGNIDARRIAMAITVDGGETWHWRIAVRQYGAPGTWAYATVFDSFPLYHEGVLHIFHAGSPFEGAFLNMDIRIGVQSAVWNGQTLALPSAG